MLLDPLNAPLPRLTVPRTLVNTTLFIPPKDVVEVKPVPATVPFVRLIAPPLPLSLTSLTVNVPKLAPDENILKSVVSSILKPRYVLLNPAPTVRAFVDAAAVAIETCGGPRGSRAGKATLPAGGVIPVMAESVVLAPWPISFWPSRSVNPPV